jgi:hypothetical protein
MKEFCEFYGIEKIHTTAYRPEGNGANERSHQELTKYFSMYLENDDKGKWRWLLPDAMYVLNTVPNASLGMSPYEALFGIVPALGAIGYPRKMPEEQGEFEKYYEMRREQVLEIRKRASELMQKAQDRAVERHNKFAQPIPFRVGDYVMYKNHTPKTKFDPKFTGPWKITDQISTTVFELAMGKYRFTAHAVYLKPYHGVVVEEPELPEESTVDEEILLPAWEESGQFMESQDEDSGSSLVLDPTDEQYGPSGRADKFLKFGKNIRKKIYRTIPQIKPPRVVSSAPITYRIPTTSRTTPMIDRTPTTTYEWEEDEPLRRGARSRRPPNRLTYSPFR